MITPRQRLPRPVMSALVCVTRLASKASPAYRDRFLAGCLPAGTGAGETGTDFFSLEASEASAFFDFSDPAAADLAGLAALAVESLAFAVGSFGADAAGCSWAAGADAAGFNVANSSFARSQCSVSLPEGYPSSSQSAYARCLIQSCSESAIFVSIHPKAETTLLGISSMDFTTEIRLIQIVLAQTTDRTELFEELRVRDRREETLQCKTTAILFQTQRAGSM